MSERAFKQVKSILGKLDRSISEARAKRLDRRPDSPADGLKGGNEPTRTPTPGTTFGRAKPLRRDRPGETGASFHRQGP